MFDLCMCQLPNPALATTMYNSLGVLYISAVAEKVGYKVTVCDLRNGDALPEAKFYGFSCTTPEITYAKEIARKVSGKTIVGGGHPSLMPDDCVGFFDYVVIGEGERAILEILEGNIKEGMVITPRETNLDAIPYPARHLVKNPYSDAIFVGERYGRGDETATMITTRGCPFACGFCANIFRNITARSVENIIGEMKLVMKDGITHFKFMDDCFTLHPQFEDLCYEIKKLNISYIAHTRSDLMKPKISNLLKMSGCYQSGLGVESADPYVLRLNNKKETPEQHKAAIAILKDAGLKVKPYWMTGLPGETDETIELNKQFIIDTQPDKWTVSTFTPYPGSAIFQNPEAYGIEIVNKDWRSWWNYVDQYVHVIKGQTREQMYARYKDFYGWLKSECWKK